jgi:hypothetical protein
MWYVENHQGDLEKVTNRATAEYLARQYGTRYIEAWGERPFTPEVNDE